MLVAKINTKVSSIHNLCSFLFIFFSWKRQTECNTGIAQAKSCETSKLYETQRWLICNFCITELNWATFTERVHINWWPLHLNVQLSHVKLPFRVTRQQKRIADRSLCCCVFFSLGFFLYTVDDTRATLHSAFTFGLCHNVRMLPKAAITFIG